jgi:hypothetical protein
MLHLKHSLCGAKSWKVWKVDHKYIKSVEKCGVVEWWKMSMGPVLWKMKCHNNLEGKERPI